ncbi:MAG: hypothetical protein HKN04_14835 [Rhodothermaceae bacterium]|nr:hypothetical protein [Rhodothermaceae bacterium]
MPVAALFSAFFLIAVPLAIFMAIWSAVLLGRTLFPERPLPVVPRVTNRSVAMPVSAREIGAALRRRHLGPSLSQRHLVADGDLPDPLAEDLWLRRN